MQSLTLPTSTLVAGTLLLDAPVDRRSALGRLGAPDLEALDHDGLIHDGRLVPWFATLVEVVAWPELAAELVRRHAGSAPARTLVWARADAAVLGRPNAGTITVASIAVGAMAEHLVEASAVPERSPDLAHPLLVGELLAALLADDAPASPRPSIGRQGSTARTCHWWPTPSRSRRPPGGSRRPGRIGTGLGAA